MVTRLVMALEGGAVVACAGEVKVSTPIGDDDIAAITSTLGTIAQSLPLHRRKVELTLCRRLAQRRLLRGVPPVRSGVLVALVSAQQGRFFRKAGGSLAVNARWVPGPGGVERLVEAVAVSEPVLDVIGDVLTRSGVKSVAVRAEGSPLRLESRSRGLRRAASTRRCALATWSAAAFMWIAAAAVHGGYLLRIDKQLNVESGELAPATQSLAVARRDVGLVAQAVAYVSVSERQRLLIARRLGAIVTALPDSAHIEVVSLSTDRGSSVTASTRDATGLVAALGRRLGGVAVAAEPTSDPAAPGSERVTLNMTAWER